VPSTRVEEQHLRRVAAYRVHVRNLRAGRKDIKRVSPTPYVARYAALLVLTPSLGHKLY
jgi:hypothetical protein